MVIASNLATFYFNFNLEHPIQFSNLCSFPVFFFLIILISDEKVPCLTPYDTIPVRQTRPKRRTVPALPAYRSKQLTDRFAKCNITDEQLMKAAAQLADICKKTSPMKSPPLVERPSLPEKPTENQNFPTGSATSKTRQMVTMPMPNFIVTKVTEKKRLNDGTKNQSADGDANNIRSFRKQQDITKTKTLMDQPKQKPIDAFNKSNTGVGNIMYTVNRNNYTGAVQPKTMEIHGSHKLNGTSNLGKTLNGSNQSKTSETSRSPSKIKLIVKGNNTEMPGKTFRLLKISAVNGKTKVKNESTKPFVVTSMHTKNVNRTSARDKQPVTSKRSTSIPRTRTIHAVTYDEPTKLIRRNSCFIGGVKTNDLIQQAINKNEEFSKLYNLCTEIITTASQKHIVVHKKRGRPRKKIYKSSTRDLLNTADYSLKADLSKLSEMYAPDVNSFFDMALMEDDAKTIRRNRGFALLSIEPVFSNTQQNNEEQNFNKYTGLKKLSFLKSNNNNASDLGLLTKPFSIDVAPISPRQTLLSPPFPYDMNQPIDDLFDNAMIDEELNSTNDMIIEYLNDIDEIESPAYEPHTSNTEEQTILNFFQTPVKNNLSYKFYHGPCTTIQSNQLNSNRSQLKQIHSEHKIEKVPSKITAHQITTPVKADLNLSPVRRSSRKRKIPADFVGLVKKTRR